MDTKTIYYVTEISGEYEDYRSIPIMAFSSRAAAEEFAQYKRDLESARQKINKKVYRLVDKEKKKYKDSDDFYQHHDEILDKIYDQLSLMVLSTLTSTNGISLSTTTRMMIMIMRSTISLFS